MKQPFTTATPILTNYDYTDISSGIAKQTFYPYYAQDSIGFWEWSLIDVPLAVPTTTGSINNDNDNLYETEEFDIPRTVTGTAVLTGFINTDGKIEAKIVKNSGALTGTAGTTDTPGVTEYSTNSLTYTSPKNWTINGYKSKVTNTLKAEGGGATASCKMKFVYIDYPTGIDVTNSTTSTTYVEKTYTNPYPNRKLSTIYAYIKTSDVGEFCKIDDNTTWKQDITTTTETDISASVSTPTYATDINFNLKIPLTDTVISYGERLGIYIKNTGSGIVIDPLNLVETTNSSLKLNIGFKVDG